MIKKFDIDAIREQYDCVNYFETGLWDSRSNSCKKALSSTFKKVYSIELCKDWIELGKKEFKDHIESNRLILINDDSNFISKYLLNNEDFKDRTLFFLDAHVDHYAIKNYINKCPLFNELEGIKQLERKNNIICIDDLRILRTANPWGEMSYGRINFVNKIKEIILTINPDYKFTNLDTRFKGDVLMAYI